MSEYGQVVGSVTVEIIPDTTNFAGDAKQKLTAEQQSLQQGLDAQRYRQAEEVARAQVKITEEQLSEIQKLHANASGSVKAGLEEQMAAIMQVRDQYKEAVGTLFDPSSPAFEPFKDVTAQRANLESLSSALEVVTQKNLIGMASEAELTAVTEAHQRAVLSTARSELVFATSLGETGRKEDIEVLKREKLRQETELLRGSTDRLAASERRRGADTLRGSLRNIGQGDGLGGIGGLGGLAKLTAVGIGITAAYRVVSELTQALKVTGDEAFTTEGKLRNMGAALIGADIVGFFRAMSAEAKSFGTQVDELGKKLNLIPGPTPVEQFQELTDKITAAKKATDADIVSLKELDQATTGGTRSSRGYSQALGLTAEELKKLSAEQKEALKESQNFTNVLKDLENEAMLTAAGFDILATAGGELGDVLSNLQTIAGQPGKFFGITDISGLVTEGRAQDATDAGTTDSVAASIARRTEALNDDLVEAGKKEARARQRLATATGEDRKAAYAAVVQATTERVNLEQRIAAAKRAADEKILADAKSAYSQSVSNQAERLRIAADASANVTAADKAYLAFLVKESRDRRLTEQERLRFQREAQAERQRQKQEVVAAAKADIDYQRSLLDLAVQKAEQLTPNNRKDDERAYRAQIAYWENEKKKAKALGKAGREAFVAADSELTSWRAKLKGLKAGGAGFSLQELFQEASDQFETFGSNIAGRAGVLSGQDERAAFGLVAQRRAGEAMSGKKGVLPGQAKTSLAITQNHLARDRMLTNAKAADPVGAAALTEAQKQTRLLEVIATGVTGRPRTSKETTSEGLDTDYTKSPKVAHHAASVQATHLTGQ